MHKKWQQELQQMKLSTEQKEQMKAAMYKELPVKKSYVHVIFPTFVAVALLLFIWGPDAPSSLSTAANYELFDGITLRIVIWLTVSQLLLVISYMLSIFCIRNIKRWQHKSHIQKLRVLFSTWQGNVLGTFTLLAIMVLMWGTTLIVPHSLVAEGFFTVAFLLFVMTLTTYMTRNAFETKCPHCDMPFSRTQLVKLGFKTEPKCPSCKQSMVNDPKYAAVSSATYTWIPALMLMQYTTLYYWYVVFLFVAIGLFIILYIVPYSVHYVQHDDRDLPPPLW